MIYAKEGMLPAVNVPARVNIQEYKSLKNSANAKVTGNEKTLDLPYNDHYFYKNTVGNPIKNAKNAHLNPK